MLLDRSALIVLSVAFSTLVSADLARLPYQKRSSVTCATNATACVTCQHQETTCLDNAVVGAEINNCIIQAQECYFDALSGGYNLYGVYDCVAAHNTCSVDAANLEGEPNFCEPQFENCDDCQTQYSACKTASDANQSYCAAQGASCFVDAMNFNGTSTHDVIPLGAAASTSAAAVVSATVSV